MTVREKEERKAEYADRRKIKNIIKKKHNDGITVILSDLPTNLWLNWVVKVVKRKAIGRIVGVKDGLVEVRTLNKTSSQPQF